MYKKRFFILILPLLFFNFNCAVGPQLSSMQIRQITTKLINGAYEDTYRACLTVLQDQGYIIKNTDMASGLIVGQVDRASSTGSQFAQALFLGYVSDKGAVIEVSCMVNKLSNSNSEVRLNISETTYGQSSVWTGTSKQNSKQIYDAELYRNIFNEIELEVKRRQAISSMSDKNISISSKGAVIPSETKDADYEDYINSLTEQDPNTFYNIIKIVKKYCLIKCSEPNNFSIGETYLIVRGSNSNYSKVGRAKVVKIKGYKIAFQIIDGFIQINDKIKYNK